MDGLETTSMDYHHDDDTRKWLTKNVHCAFKEFSFARLTPNNKSQETEIDKERIVAVGHMYIYIYIQIAHLMFCCYIRSVVANNFHAIILCSFTLSIEILWSVNKMRALDRYNRHNEKQIDKSTFKLFI